MDPNENLVAGRYQLLELAGDGGMARVYRAVTRGAAGFSRMVALKRVHDHLAGSTEFVRMFIEEARISSELEHANIVQVHDFGFDGNGYYLVMEWVDGLHLGQYASAFTKRGERVPWRFAALIGAQVLAALASAHERVNADGVLAPVIHRDVTPHNVLLSVQGIVKLADFGLARAMDRASPQSDIYAVGIALWESLTGERLYAADTDAERIRKVREGAVPPIESKRDDLPDGLIAIVHSALERDPAQRFASAHEMEHALLRLMGGNPVNARELGQSVTEARVAMGLLPRSIRPPPMPDAPANNEDSVRTSRAVVVKPIK